MSPHVPDVGEVGAGVAELLLGERPEVVVLLDVPAVVALAGLSGRPIVLADGEQVPPERLLDVLLVESYAEAGADEAVQGARRAELRAAAGAAATAVLGADVDPLAAVRVLGELAAPATSRCGPTTRRSSRRWSTSGCPGRWQQVLATCCTSA
jgi:hypothetical protein